MGKKWYSSKQFAQHPRLNQDPDSGFTEIFADSENEGQFTAVFPNGETASMVRNKLQISEVASDDSILIPGTAGPFNLVNITSSVATKLNIVTLPTPVNGQFLFIRNGDTHGTSGDINIPSGKLVQLLAMGNAWHVVGFATTVG